MKRQIFVVMFVLLSLVPAAGGRTYAQNADTVMLMISEQNIDGPRSAWWASEVDLSAAETAVSQVLLGAGFGVVDPAQLHDELARDKAYRRVDIAQASSLKLAAGAGVEYVLVGKAVASAGGAVPQSTMRSCYANVTAKLLRVSDKKVIAYLDAAGSSVHPDVITGGKEALVSAGRSLGEQLVKALRQSAAVK